MRVGYHLNRKSLASVLVALSIASLIFVSSVAKASAAPTGANFDHIVIIAMENQNYVNVLGDGSSAGCPSGTAPFLCGLLPLSSTIPNYHSYGAGGFSGDSISGCSAACYVALISGDTYGTSDGYGCCLSGTTLVDQMQSAGLTWQAYCEAGCPRGNDHFAFTGFASDANSPNVFAGSSVSTSTFIAAANSANPPNLLWYTPTDNHNMHDNSIQTGDSYLQQFLVGSGTVLSPASGSLLASSLFTSSSDRTLLYVWWDEYDPSPNVIIGAGAQKGFVSQSNAYDEYASLHTIENNWGLSLLGYASSAPTMSDIFGPNKLSASFTYLPLTPLAGVPITFTGVASGGTLPYTYSWNFGDGGTGTGLVATHTYSLSGSYSVTVTVTDSASATANPTQIVQVSQVPALVASFSYTPSQPTSGQSITFTGSGTGGVSPYTYSWSFGDAATSTGKSPSHTYTNSGSFTVALSVTDSLGTVATKSQSITVSPPGALTASFTISPSVPVSGQTVTFTATVSGGTSPYSYGWNLGGTIKTVNPVSQSFTNGTYNIALTVTDNVGSTATSSQSLTVLRTSNVGSVPVLIGWGAVGLGESLSDIQSEMQSLSQSGYNIVRVDFEPTCTTPPDGGILGSYDATKMSQVIALAKQYNLWIIVDYHGYVDLQTSSAQQCWLGFWKSLVQNFTASYSQIIWEPINEPQMTSNTDVAGLSSAYQAVINEVRALGDTHWIVVQNLCSSSCGFGDTNMAAGYPSVNDTVGHVFISLHSYMAYQWYSSAWNNVTADTLAQDFYSAVVTGMKTTGRPALNTEGGADPIAANCSGGVSLPSSLCAPDQILVGSAGYSLVTFHFIQTLTNLYDSNSPQRINWVWWPAGSWTDTPGAGVYGATQCNSNPIGWGCLLKYTPVSSGGIPPPPSSSKYTLSFQGYDFDGANEETLTMNGNQVATFPTVLTTSNGATWVSFSFNITSFAVQGTNTISFTHANSDCAVSDQVRNLVVTNQTSTIYSNATVENINTATSCTNTLTYTFTIGLPSPPPAPNFTISATSPGAVNTGQSTLTTITITSLNGFAGTVALTDTVPNGLSCGNMSNTSIAGSGTATVSCSATNTGSYTLMIAGTSGSLAHSATTTFNFRDFTVSASSPAAVSTGSSGTSTITLNPLNGFSGTIAISVAIPSGLVCGSVTPSSVTGSGTATLSCSSNSQGVYTVTVTATSGSLTHQSTAAFSFGTPPNFTVSATSPSAANVGSSAKSTITITLVHGLTGTVTLTISAPSGMNCGAVSSTSFAANGTATVSCSSSSASTYTLTVTGMSGSLTHTATAIFTFQDFSLSATPSSLSINTGGQGTSTISLNLLNGFGSTVALSVSSPTGVTGALSTAAISGSGTSTLTISPTTVGSYTVVVTGTSGSLTRTRSLTISVGTQVSPILTAPSTETVVQTSTVTFAVTATDSSVPTSSLTLSANQLPLDSSFATIQGTSPVSGTFTWTPTTADAPGTYAVSFIVTNGVSSAQTYVIITLVSANVLPIITVPGRLNATAGTNLHFTVSATDPTGTGGAVILSATGLAPNMAFDPASGVFSFTPSSSQAGGIFTVNFTATDSNDPSLATTQSVPIHVMNSSAQPSGGGLCLSCLLPRSMTTSAWLLAIGALVGMISAIAMLHLRASAEIAIAKRRLMSMNTQNQISQTYKYRDRRRVAAQGSPRSIQDE